ncbi:hypothetical protein PILCRDRAFT_812867 [Piloderma croceum F 1598]|uniref:Uncharacterized protein n=1 Tax=Piloderma croceum (strain F 1598) TaxID=765440 RepID=A0A0C3GHE2_PILCF|nr:hypothetical protein PILCRDRAFT_812867 [Piloderma croceum F 1598]
MQSDSVQPATTTTRTATSSTNDGAIPDYVNQLEPQIGGQIRLRMRHPIECGPMTHVLVTAV